MNATDSRRHAADVVAAAITARVFPAATLEVGHSQGPLWQEAFGSLTFDAEARLTAFDTLFDLASLTKVIATTTVVMELIERQRLSLDEPVSALFSEWRSVDREQVTLADLLEHASGLPPRLVDRAPEGRREFEHEICSIALEYAPRSRSVYGDLDFILVGFGIADRSGGSLAEPWTRVLSRLSPESRVELMFHPAPALAERIAPTVPLPDDVRRGRRLVGEVHDNYAAALGGTAGHAGLFGTAAAVGLFARTMLGAVRGSQDRPAPFSPELVTRFVRRSTVPGSSRALGWDTMLLTSSCGRFLSTAAFGHTGFTGTSLWIDPLRDRYFVLLTNRVCDGGSAEDMQRVRRDFHNALRDL